MFDAQYDMAFAYSVASMGMYIVSLVVIIDRIFVERGLQGQDLVPTKYSNTLYAQMDLTVTSNTTQKVLSKGYANQMKILIAEEFALHSLKEMNNDIWVKVIFYVRRAAGAIITVLTFAFAIYLINIAINHGEEINAKFAYGVPLLLAIVKQGLPIFLNIGVAIEARESIEDVLQAGVGRVYVFKMLNLGIMFWQTYTNVENGTLGADSDCVETEIGKVFYNGMLMDMFVVGGTVVGTSFLMYKLNNMAEEVKEGGRSEFNHELVGQNIIDLMYRQAMIWCGATLSPVLCAWGSLMNLVIFKIQMKTFLITHRPPEKAWGASDSNNFFLYLLLLTLCVAWIPGMVFMERTMHCGPYESVLNPNQAIANFMETVPDAKALLVFLMDPMILMLFIVMQIIRSGFTNADLLKVQRQLEQTDEEWHREKEEKETLMRRCLEAGMSKEELDKGGGANKGSVADELGKDD